jgi:predicted RNase H-like nuclease (RuvC/YqgF family)
MEKANENEVVYSFAEVASRLGESTERLRALIGAGRIKAKLRTAPYTHMDFLISEEALNQYLKEEKSEEIGKLEKKIQADQGRLEELRAELDELG